MSLEQTQIAKPPESLTQAPLMGLFLSAESTWRKKAQEMFPGLNPILRVLLSTDGTVTKSLESYFWETVSVDVHSHQMVKLKTAMGPLDLKQGDEVLRRSVVLRLVNRNQPMVYAESFVRVDRLWPDVQMDLIRGRLGIGEVLNNRRMAQYRNIFRIWREPVGNLADRLQVAPDSELVCRSYSITAEQSTIMVITEKFVLDRFMLKPAGNAA